MTAIGGIPSISHDQIRSREQPVLKNEGKRVHVEMYCFITLCMLLVGDGR